ncbi:hypothetical protein [Streptomyces sp. NPDC096351]|uniref:hypothetical protein n=1 Tax=Streptomyces sp. NPDC096351 TaxID=3366087 RepID=UPI00382C4DEE
MNEFDDLSDTLVPTLEALSGARLAGNDLDHRELVRWMRFTCDGPAGPRMSLLDRLERMGQSRALPDTLNAALRASRPDQERTAVAARVRYALLLASLPGQASGLPPGLLPRLLDNGIWTADRARTATEQITDPHVRTRRLAELVRHSPGDHALTAAVRYAVDQCDPTRVSGREAILDALPHLPRQERVTAMERLLPTAGRDRLAAMLLLVSELEPEHTNEAFSLVCGGADLTEDEAHTALALLYPVLPPRLQETVLPGLLDAAAPDAAPAPAAALTTLLAHTDGAAHATLRAFVLARHGVSRRAGASVGERVTASMIRRAAVCRWVPAGIAGLLLGWWLESSGRSSQEEFLPLAVVATVDTGLPTRCVRVAAVACASSAPDRYRDVFPYSSPAPGGRPGHLGDLNTHIRAVVHTSPTWLLYLLRNLVPRVAAWWGRREGTTAAEARSLDIIARSAVAAGPAGAEDLLVRSEAAHASGLLEGDVRSGVVAEAAQSMPDHALPRVAALLEQHGDFAEVLLVVAAFLPHLRPADRAAYATLIREQTAVLCKGAPEVACDILRRAGPHLGDEASAALDILWSIGRDADLPGRETDSDSSSLLSDVADACVALLPALPPGRLSRARGLLARCPAGAVSAQGMAYLAAGRHATPEMPRRWQQSSVGTFLSRARGALWAAREALRWVITADSSVEVAVFLAAVAPVLPRRAARLARAQVLRLITRTSDLTYASGESISAALADVVRQESAQADAALAAARALSPTGLRIRVLRALLPHLPTSAQQPVRDEITASALTRPGLTDYGHVVTTALLLPWTRPPEPLVERLTDAVDSSWNAVTRAAAYASVAENAPAALRTPLLDEGLSAAAMVEDTPDRVEWLGRLARVAASTPGYRGVDSWTLLMCEGAGRSRSDLLADLAALAPLAAHAGGPKAAAAIIRALLDVRRVWP